MSTCDIQLIVGLGNPGERYAQTRHNAGFWFVDALADRAGVRFVTDTRLQGELADAQLAGCRVRLLKPQTFMNLSGRCIGAVARYFKIPDEAILVVHDELDLPAGTARLKRGGGHGGHNGLRDITAHLSENFWRLRLGIGRPPAGREVVGYVLDRPTADDEKAIRDAMAAGEQAVDSWLRHGSERAMLELHTRRD